MTTYSTRSLKINHRAWDLYEQAHKFVQEKVTKRASRVSFQRKYRQPRSREGQRTRTLAQAMHLETRRDTSKSMLGVTT